MLDALVTDHVHDHLLDLDVALTAEADVLDEDLIDVDLDADVDLELLGDDFEIFDAASVVA